MATNNSTTSNICQGYEEYKRIGDQMDFIINYITAPIGIILCTLVYLLCLIVYQRQARKGEFGFVYPSLYCAGETILAVNEGIFVLTRYFWSGFYGRYTDWFVSCYACMWYTAHMVLAVCDFFLTLTWMLCVCMAADRVFALWKPFVYRNIDQKKHQMCAVCISVVISVYISAYDWFSNEVQEDQGRYRLVVNNAFLSGPGALFTPVNTSIRILLAVVLITCNVGTVYLYRAYLQQQATLFEIKDRKKESERTLAFLCACQSAFNALDIVRVLIAYTLYYMNPKLYLCGAVAVYGGYVFRWVCKLGDFCVLFMLSKQFRAMFRSALTWKRKTDVTGTGFA